MGQTTSRKYPSVFIYRSKFAREVFLIGTFTNWEGKLKMNNVCDGEFVTWLDLPEGEHQYKFVVDDEWKHDPFQPTIDDNLKGKNNVRSIKKSDFELVDAMGIDLNEGRKELNSLIHKKF